MFRFSSDFRVELQRNWIVLAIAFSCLLFGISAPTFAMPFLYPEVIAEFGWSRAEATLLASAKYLMGAAIAMIVGRYIDVIGAWLALILCLAIGGAAMIAFLWVSSLSGYYIAGIMLGFAGPGGIVALKVLIARSFNLSQGTAMGLTLTGASLGAVLMPILAGLSIQHFGWRGGFALLSLGIWLLSMPLLAYGYFSKNLTAGKSTRRQRKDGTNTTKQSHQPGVRSIMRTRDFWLIAGAVFLAALVDQAFQQHQVLLLNDTGMEATTVAFAISAIGLLSMIARVVIGTVLDRSSNKGLSFLYLSLTASSLVAMFLVSPVLIVAFVTLRAFAHSAQLLDVPIMTKHTFGLSNIGALLGIYTGIVCCGFALGPWLVGYMYDIDGTYLIPFALCGALTIVGAVLMWYVRPHYWLDLKRSDSIDADQERGLRSEPASS